MTDSDDLDLRFGDDILDPPPVPAPKKTKAKVKKAAVKAPPEEEVEEVEAELLDELDPEDDRENWPTIRLDSEEGKPNYEFLAAHGTKKDGTTFQHELQVRRGDNVQVPPSIVHVLRDMIATHHVPYRDASGRVGLIRQDRGSIPWQLVKGGKYIK